MLIIIYKKVYIKALLIFYFCLSPVLSLFIIIKAVNLLMPLLTIYKFFNKKNPLSKALIVNINKSIF
jgi:hypothetical protein